MTMFNGEGFIYGYPKDELMLFALACREAGITNEKLHEIDFNIEWAVDAVRKEVEQVVRKNLDDIVNRIAEQTEPSTERHLPDYSYESEMAQRLKDSTDCAWK